jgi:hypothetical protein
VSFYLFESDLLPNGFRYPESFSKLIESGQLPKLEPWWFLGIHEETAKYWLNALSQQYPTRSLVPYAKMEDSDDLACFDGLDGSGDPVVHLVHAFASPGWENRGAHKNFNEWMSDAGNFAVEYRAEHSSD